ncbi:hypothetical protein MTO96_001178 [Rhipicephalus appendiculatus]
MPPLAQGTVVRIRDNASSRKGRVVDAAGPRSCIVQTGPHHMLRRNRRHLLRTREDYCPESSDDEYSAPSTPLRTAATGCRATTDSSAASDETASSGSTDSAQPACMLPRHEPTPVIQAEVPSTPTATAHACASNPAPRRSTRSVKPPQRLAYDANFQQIV